MKKSLTKTSFIFLMIFLGISFFSIMINSPILTALENTTFLRIIDFINQNYISKGGIIISFATNIRDVVNIFISVFYRLLSLFSILSLILSIIFSKLRKLEKIISIIFLVSGFTLSLLFSVFIKFSYVITSIIFNYYNQTGSVNIFHYSYSTISILRIFILNYADLILSFVVILITYLPVLYISKINIPLKILITIKLFVVFGLNVLSQTIQYFVSGAIAINPSVFMYEFFNSFLFTNEFLYFLNFIIKCINVFTIIGIIIYISIFAMLSDKIKFKTGLIFGLINVIIPFILSTVILLIKFVSFFGINIFLSNI